VALGVKTSLQAKMSLVSARLELFGTESVAHDHFFKDFVLLETSLPTQLLIDATALRDDDIKCCGVWLTMIDGDSHELTSFHPTTAQVSTSGIVPLTMLKTLEHTHTTSSVASPQPRIVATITPAKANSQWQNDYMYS
jgi:hypothetical protein